MNPRRLSCAALLLLGLSGQSVLAGQASRGSHNKIDRALADALASGEETQRIIITVLPGFRDGVRDALKSHGDVIKSEHPSVDAIAAIVHSGDISELANHPGIKYVSIDATVYAGAAGRYAGSVPHTVLSTSPNSS